MEELRPIYTNLIKFFELHPTKIKIGVFAPTTPNETNEGFKATGTEGSGSSDFSRKKEASVLPFAPLSTREGSTSVTIGAPIWTSLEPRLLTTPLNY